MDVLQICNSPQGTLRYVPGMSGHWPLWSGLCDGERKELLLGIILASLQLEQLHTYDTAFALSSVAYLVERFRHGDLTQGVTTKLSGLVPVRLQHGRSHIRV